MVKIISKLTHESLKERKANASSKNKSKLKKLIIFCILLGKQFFSLLKTSWFLLRFIPKVIYHLKGLNKLEKLMHDGTWEEQYEYLNRKTKETMPTKTNFLNVGYWPSEDPQMALCEYILNSLDVPKYGDDDDKNDDDMRILNIGCGNGDLEIHGVNKQKFKGIWTGLDIVPEHIKLANKNLEKVSEEEGVDLTKRIDFMEGDCTNLDKKYENTFDRILIMAVFAELKSDQIQKTLAQAEKCLKKGGKLIIYYYSNQRKPVLAYDKLRHFLFRYFYLHDYTTFYLPEEMEEKCRQLPGFAKSDFQFESVGHKTMVGAGEYGVKVTDEKAKKYKWSSAETWATKTIFGLMGSLCKEKITDHHIMTVEKN